MTVVLCW